MAMCDVDHVKRFNDAYGHDVGDQVRMVAAKLSHVGGGGRAFRYGGEEFLVWAMKTWQNGCLTRGRVSAGRATSIRLSCRRPQWSCLDG